MTVQTFWDLIDEAREEAGGWEEMTGPLVRRLAGCPLPDILTWGQMFSEYQRLSYKEKLWAAAYVINGGCSDDGFDYFRGWLTAQGRAVFLGALRDPESLAEVESCEEDVELEDMLSVATEAYFAHTGAEGRPYDQYYDALNSHPLPEQLLHELRQEIAYAEDIDVVWEEEGDQLSRLLPRLCAKFGWEN